MAADRTIDQAINVATLPGVQKHVIVLPDGHEGYGFPVGAVAAMDLAGRNGIIGGGGVVSPGSVGYDINCGVRLIQTNLTVLANITGTAEDPFQYNQQWIHVFFGDLSIHSIEL